MRWLAIVVGALLASGVSCSADGSSPAPSSLAPSDGCPIDPSSPDQLDGLLPRAITLEGRTFERPKVEVVASQRDEAGVLYIVGNLRDSEDAMIVSGAEWAFDGDLLALNDAAFTHSAALDGRTILTAAGEGTSSLTLHELRRCAAGLTPS